MVSPPSLPAGGHQGAGAYGLGANATAPYVHGTANATYGHAVYGHGTNVEDGNGDVQVTYYREGDEGYIPPLGAMDDQYYGLDMNGRGRVCGYMQPRQAPSVAARSRGRGRGHGVTTSPNEVHPVVRVVQSANGTVGTGSSSQLSAKNTPDSQADSMDWKVPEHVSIVCSLFAEQVEKGNRPNTRLNAVGYAKVSNRFFQMTGIELSKIQLKNKWEKLKGDFTAWQKLMRRQTGTGCDHLRKTIEMDCEWWRKIKAEIPGCAKFKKGPLQNEADLLTMFNNITNDESDHWNPMTENPAILESQEPIINVDEDFVDAENEFPNYLTLAGGDVAKEESPSVGNGKKRSRAVLEKSGRRTKTSTAVVMQEQMTRIADSADAAKKCGEVTIKQVMELVVACGEHIGSNEYFIANKLFTKREQREMFMTLDMEDSRFLWLRRHYKEQYEE
ncbi:hypothetical protein BS78_04G190600 [Paspalum vaginatum]|nr:hypothetical protein BS78_04G190600 [Paspalum vaginatum]